MREPAFERLGTSTISDALDALNREGCLFGLSSLGSGQRMIGRAYTVGYQPAGAPAGTVGDYIDDVSPGQVMVLDNAGRVDCTVWGDILTAVAQQNNLAGTVIDGACRDTARALATGYPIYSRGRYMRTGKDRVEVTQTGQPVRIAGILIHAGQLIIGDADGVVTIPPDIEDDVASIGTAIAQREDAILSDALSGNGLAEARRRHGYHVLQRPPPQR